jgi:hypothetical protein
MLEGERMEARGEAPANEKWSSGWVNKVQKSQGARAKKKSWSSVVSGIQRRLSAMVESQAAKTKQK